MDIELLNWYGNLLNFVILIYLILNVINTSCFNPSQTLIAAFGLMISILIHFRNLIKN
ncbi:hypothetical protein ES703_80531 [subsurface metagenome]